MFSKLYRPHQNLYDELNFFYNTFHLLISHHISYKTQNTFGKLKFIYTHHNVANNQQQPYVTGKSSPLPTTIGQQMLHPD